MPRILGVTGSIGGGKSTVSKVLAHEHGAVVLDADQIAGQVAKSPEVLKEIRTTFGDEVIVENDGNIELDRSALATKVFSDTQQLRRLEAILHPKVRLEIEAEIKQNQAADLIVLDVPLLFEAGLSERCIETWMVDADREIRLHRVSKRGWNDSELARREQNQWSVERKRESADVIIDNGGTIAELKKRVHNAISRVLK